MKKEIPLLVMEKILRKAGAERVSETAKKEMQKQLEKKAKDISKKAKEMAEHASRKTVKKEDINLILEN